MRARIPSPLRPLRVIALAAALPVAALLALPAAGAGTRTETLRWAHPNPSAVAGFRVHVGSSSRQYDRALDVGLPQPSAGVFTYDLNVPDTEDVFVAISAYAPSGASSVFSNEQLRAAPVSGGGTGGGPAPGSGSGDPGGSPGGDTGGTPETPLPDGSEALGTPGQPRVIVE